MPVEISVAQKEGKLKDDDPPEPASSTLQGLEETIGNLSIKDVAAPYAKPNCTVVDTSSDSAEESSDDDNNAASSSAKTKPKQADTTSEESAGEEEEQEIKSVLETGEDNPADNYVAKGPMRRIEAKAHNGNPYQKPQQHQQPQQPQQQLQDLGECLSNDLGGKGGSCSGDLDLVSMGQFLDEIYPELNLDQISLGGPMGIPGLPETDPTPVNNILMNTIDNLFGTDPTWGSRIIMKNDSEDSGFSMLPTPLSFVLDHYHNRIGINIPKQTIPTGCIKPEQCSNNKLEIYIQLDPKVTRVIKVVANIEKVAADATTGEYWTIKAQFLRLQPFMGRSGLEILLEGVSPNEIKDAHDQVSNWSKEQLMKKLGPSQSSVLMTLVLQPDTPKNRAQILAVTKKLLASTDPGVRKSITERCKGIKSNVLEVAALRNKPALARFFAEVFYDLGEDLNCQDSEEGNTLFHMTARKGDDTAPVMDILLNLRFHEDRKVFRTNIPNTKQELPIHIAARNDKCHTQVIQLLSQDMPGCFAMASREGSLPIHTACQFSRDPTLIAALLYYNRSVVNVPRADGFTPLHLVSARHDVSDQSIGLIPLDEDTQVRMVRILLDHGADKTLRVENYLPGNLLRKDRTKVMLLLKLRRGEGSRQSSPTSGSPPTNSGNGCGGFNGYHHQQPHQTMLNNLNRPPQQQQQGIVPASPAGSSGFGDMSSPGSLVSSNSPPHNMDFGYNGGYPAQNSPYGTGSVMSSGPEGSSDNEESGPGGAQQPSGQDQQGQQGLNNNLDAIAEVLFQHPAIRDAVAHIPE